jgi:hypothetical protein
MSEGFRYAVGSLGALLAIFGAFLLLWQRYQYCAGGCRLGPRSLAAAWALVLLGAGALAASFLLSAGEAPAVPPFLQGGGV